MGILLKMNMISSFRPHDWGSFFNYQKITAELKRLDTFRPHDWGSFFNMQERGEKLNDMLLFVPMIGDLFLIFLSFLNILFS